MTALVLLLYLLLPLRRVASANWAQVSGKRQTNAAVLEPTPWGRRHGHAVAALDFSDDYVRATGQRARLFVIGGDTSVQGKQDLRAYPGGGSLENDVWATTGNQWRVEANILKLTKWGDPLAQTIANLTWLQTNNGKRPPRGVTYDDWIACAANAWAVHPVQGCDDPTQPPGAYLADNMFSPRRNFVALAFRDELFVLGGRAREHVPVPEAELRAGVGLVPGPRNVRWREYAVLKNDVWRSSDAGASWKLVTPGCKMPQASLTRKLPTGSEAFQCETDDDCEGDASCAFDERASAGVCVCNMWSPREFHAAVVHDGALFVAGGYALVQLHNCGVDEYKRHRASGEEFACGGGYRAYMNDVWTSRDGQTWTLLTLHAAFAPRGEHAMLSFRSMLYVFGGRTGDPVKGSSRALLNDIYVSSNGSRWGLHTAQAPWSPRAKHVVLALPGVSDVASGEDPLDEVLLLFGEDEERTLDDVWSWRGGDASVPWVQDYSHGTDAARYVSLSGDVSFLRGIKDAHVTALQAQGIASIADLPSLSFAQIVALRATMPICDYVRLAKEIVATCSVWADRNEGDEFKNMAVIQGKNGDALAAKAAAAAAGAAAMTEDTWDGCTHIGTPLKDAKTKRLRWPDVKGVDQVPVLRDVFDDAQASVCQWRPRGRSGHAGVVFQRKAFVVGGLTAPDYFENDVWYRDKRLPRASFTRVPASGTSQTVFQFESDEPGCTFEYHVLDVVEQLVVRNWTRTLGVVDVEPWLAGGKHRFRVRAVDPAGNVDQAFEPGRNEHVWVYKPKLPWALILGLTGVAVVLLLALFMEWRKRRRRRAMERYAMKRMRRKLKGKKMEGKEGDANWRETYDDAKKGKNKSKKKTKKKGDESDKDDKKKTKKSKTKGAKSKDDKAKDKASKGKTSAEKDKKKAKKTEDKSKKQSAKSKDASTKDSKKKSTKETKAKTKDDKVKPKKDEKSKKTGDAAKKASKTKDKAPTAAASKSKKSDGKDSKKSKSSSSDKKPKKK
ncbi:hypothetical protein PINS_up013223 [Pythium insidiosum]|nr:hypothetical protein PINS_up013223 [Pythium insidiosum]